MTDTATLARRKIDLRLVPILAAIYTMALVDRTNLGSARIAGLDEATGLNVGNHASITSEHFNEPKVDIDP